MLPAGWGLIAAISALRSMAAVLTLVRTLPEAESCSFSESDETPEIPLDEGDREGSSGLISSGMKVTLGMVRPWRPKPIAAPNAVRLPRHTLLSKTSIFASGGIRCGD